ncbi:MAG: hypothetical protein J6S67_14340 [Methanobrevibacter sp.]|nr:hypothetical protein [Methanobrevibacter sp.]
MKTKTKKELKELFVSKYGSIRYNANELSYYGVRRYKLSEGKAIEIGYSFALDSFYYGFTDIDENGMATPFFLSDSCIVTIPAKTAGDAIKMVLPIMFNDDDN